MTTANRIKMAKTELIAWWGKDGEAVIEKCIGFPSLDITFDQFLDYCTACDNSSGDLLLSGIAKLRKPVWDTIPEHMGKFAHLAICDVLILCGVTI